ncbi:MAG: peptide deformylase, partial [Nitrosomonadales bacterium]|nr:peptide deformylase [Nitrosomonadales bacterium]
MAIRTVLRMGDPLLLQKAAHIEVFDTPELHALI